MAVGNTFTLTEMAIGRNKAQHELCLQVNLMQYMKLSTSRDFRINTETLEAALQEQDGSLDVSSSPYAQTDPSSRNSSGSISCLFSGHGVSASRGDTRTQTEEEKTLGFINGTSCWVK